MKKMKRVRGKKMNKNKKPKLAKQGDKITEKKCPGCNEELIVQTKDGAEVFVCENCKFEIKKK